MKKINFTWMISLILLIGCLCPMAAYSMEPAVNSETGYQAILEDDAALLTETEQESLLQEMMPITAYSNVMLKTVVQNSTTAENYAKQVYREKFGTSSGTLFLIDMDNRMLYIFSGGSAYQIITTAYANTITDNVYQWATAGNYYQCAKSVFEQEYTLLEGGRIAQPMKYITNALLASTLAILTTFAYMLFKRRKIKVESSKIKPFVTAVPVVAMAGMVVHSVTKRAISSGSSGGGGHFGGGGGGGFSGGGGGHKF